MTDIVVSCKRSNDNRTVNDNSFVQNSEVRKLGHVLCTSRNYDNYCCLGLRNEGRFMSELVRNGVTHPAGWTRATEGTFRVQVLLRRPVSG